MTDNTLNKQAAGTDANVPTFGFGKNWADYIEKNFSEERVETSKRHLLGFLDREHLNESTFLDVGCGSGLHSLAAFRAGASRVMSFDVDENSVATTKLLWEREGSPENWAVCSGSALDEEFLESLGVFDIVYSWGVLHHTGSMWKAIQNVAPRVAQDGLFYVALYTTSHRSPYWIDLKRRYNQANEAGKRWIELKYFLKFRLLSDLLHRQNTYKLIKNYKESRGMDFMTDMRDWLGGYPYEDCTPDELLEFSQKVLDMNLTKIKTGEACTEYLLKRK